MIRPGGDDFKAEFGTLSGADYRVSVFKHEDIDPFRAVFLLTLMSGELDEELQGKKWLEQVNDERFYEGILEPAVDHAVLEPEKIEELVIQGKQYLARTDAQRNRASYSAGVLQRAKTIDAFPRPAKKDDEPKQLRPFKKGSDETGQAEALEAPAEEAPKQLPPSREAEKEDSESADPEGATSDSPPTSQGSGKGGKGKGGKGKGGKGKGGKGQGRPNSNTPWVPRRRFKRAIDQSAKFFKIRKDE